jgi:hypothetical protein
MQSMVDRLRGDENQPTPEEQEMAEKLIDMLLSAVESGQITAEQAKEIIRNAPNTMEEMSTTGGPASFTSGHGMQYAQALDKSERYFEDLKENYSKFKKAARERNSAGQLNAGVSIVRKKLSEVNKMMEYLATLKSDLTTAGMVNETSHIKKSMDKMTEMIKQIYIKQKKLR